MDDFSDDGFDDLPDNALQELENTAIQFTQAQTQIQQPSQPREVFDLDFEDDDLDDTVVFDELAQHPAKPPQLPQGRVAPAVTQPRQQWSATPVAHSHSALSNRPRYPNSSQTGAAPYGQQGPPSSARPASTFQRPPSRVVPPPRPAHPTTGRHQQHAGFTGQQSQFTAPQPTGGAPNEIIAALQARVNALQKDLTTTKGESALLRSKLQDAQAAHEADLQRLRKANAEQLAKQERIAEQALAAEKTAATELQFDQQDLKDGSRHRKGKKPDKEKDGNHDVGSTTPKKGAGARTNWGMADGFDDMELVPSPSKGATRRSRDPVAIQPPILSQVERTPTKGKRKRPAVDSPLLELETDDVVMLDGQPSVKGRAAAPLNFRPAALPFDFLTLVLDHGAVHGQPLTFDLFARYSFPSDQSQTFASLIFSKLPLLGNPLEPVRLLIDFAHLLIELWSQCLHEKYYEPIYDLVALLSFTLQLQTTSVAPHIISYLLPIAQATIHLLAIPLFESLDGDISNSQDPAIERLLVNIDTTSVLGVMYLAALGCLTPSPKDSINRQSLSESPNPSFIQQYWSTIQPEFVLTMLSPKQKPEDLLGMLVLLRTSSFSASVGPLTDEPSKNVDVVAPVLIDRISYFLAEPPTRWAPARSRRQCEARLAALETLVSFSRSPFGLAKLVQSNNAIPRVVAALSGAIDQLYDMDIPSAIPNIGEIDVYKDKKPSQADPDATQDQGPPPSAPVTPALSDTKQENENTADLKPPAALLHALIALSVSLLHKLVMMAATVDENVASKLAASHGGAQRYLLTLARLNFAEEDLVLEAGISAETAELANELLELAVTPDEGEGVRDVFEFGDS
ncbi:hypothetical protein MGG_17795 [Pyricularia oryzae 70-15]|uniref:DNA repair protein Rad26 n=1 Tax=Pyricularia oryzae (strain 70-15 / ATCC MYA-4617 / FGSC 8958) TaxID=242507 RepID=G4NI18_PYRO7|nr:uncharacterized protein MGG_17795 [Pyricularia oryzae 70-15]EHA47878.1 hypothetical protein MGG_17795 [Pyricularia oryzae 70-15]